MANLQALGTPKTTATIVAGLMLEIDTHEAEIETLKLSDIEKYERSIAAFRSLRHHLNIYRDSAI